MGEIVVAADADQAAPSPRADQRTESGLAEVERKRVAARSASAIDQHHLRAEVRDRRRLLGRRIAGDRPVRAAVSSAGAGARMASRCNRRRSRTGRGVFLNASYFVPWRPLK